MALLMTCGWICRLLSIVVKKMNSIFTTQMSEEDGDANSKCEVEMGERSMGCLWNATGSGCAEWCRNNAKDWSEFILDVLDAGADTSSQVSVVLDKLCMEGRVKGLFSRNAGYSHYEADFIMRNMSTYPIGASMTVSVTALALVGSDVPQKDLDDWENDPSIGSDREERSWRGRRIASISVTSLGSVDSRSRPDIGNYITIIEDVGVHRMWILYGAEKVAGALTKFMEDKTLSGQRMLFKFDVPLGDWSSEDIEGAIDAYSMCRSTSGWNERVIHLDGKSCEEGSAHISMGINGRLGEWHSLVSCNMILPQTKSETDVNLSIMFSW